MSEMVRWVCHDCDVNGAAHKAAITASAGEAATDAQAHFDANPEHRVIVFSVTKARRLTA